MNAMVDYRAKPLGTKEHGGEVQVCPICNQRGLTTKGKTRTFVCHYFWMKLTIDENGKEALAGGDLTHDFPNPPDKPEEVPRR
jgi:hypothetical protein